MNKCERDKCKMNYMKKMSKKIFAAIVIIAIIVSAISGCQLADKNSSGEDIANKDIFCGLYVSTEDLFEVNRDLVKDERIYAAQVNEEAEEDNGPEHYKFKECKGIAVFMYNLIESSGYLVTTSGSGTDNDAADMHLLSRSVDEGMEKEITATIYINEDVWSTDVKIYTYPVYQTSEGKIYLQEGERMGITDEMKYKLSETTTSDISGKLEKYSCSVEISFDILKPTEKTIVHQMNAENEEIGINVIDNKKLGEAIEVAKKTEYIIVEEYVGNEVIEREVVNMKDYQEEYKEEDDEDYEPSFETSINEDDIFVKMTSIDVIK